MKNKIYCLFVLFVSLVSINSFSQSNPSPFDLSMGNYSFTQWDSLATPGTYPANMIFHFTNNPSNVGYDSSAVGNADWDCAYNRKSRNRIVGMMNDGFAFRATSSPQYNDCNGTDSTSSSSRFVGASVLGLNTLNRMNVQVSWTGKTDSIGDGTPLPRVFTLRLQYRVGTSGNFTDIAGAEYLSTVSGNSQIVGPITLPPTCNNQPVVQLRWLYFQKAANNGGTRPQMSVDEISVTSAVFIGINENDYQNFHTSIYPNPTSSSINILTDKSGRKEIRMYDSIGNELKKFISSENKIILSRENYPNGFYFVQLLDENGVLISNSKTGIKLNKYISLLRGTKQSHAMKNIALFLAMTAILISLCIDLYSQTVQVDTLKVMSYNVNNYGFPSTTNCPNLAASNKHPYLRTIIQYADPDILGLVKMDASPVSFSTDTVIDKVLDSVCMGCYTRATFTNNSGYAKVNMLYFKTNKFGFVSTTTIYSGDPNISDINLHKLYYKSVSLAQTHDTVFINVVLVHLRSGSNNDGDRENEINGAMSWLNAHVANAGNYIFMGDFNVQSSNENCYQALINSPNPNTQFSDPENQLGDWSNSPALFSNCLTQSTRTTDPGDCGAVGGMNDRFDHILLSSSIMNGNDSLKYIPGSFTVLGQDGNHTGISLIDPPANTSAPAQVLISLYYMSSHLPVTVHLAVSSTVTGISDLSSQHTLQVHYNSVVTNDLVIKIGSENKTAYAEYFASIYNMHGAKVFEQILNINQLNTIPTGSLPMGLYIVRITNEGVSSFTGKFIKSDI